MADTLTLRRLGPIQAVPLGEGRVYRVGELEIAVFRSRTGEVYATDAKCPHQGGPLADGVLGDHCVVCPLHSYLFDLRTGHPSGRTCQPVTTYQVTVQADGELELDVP
jgi:nitrite reductase (NADH) small subunit